MSDQSEAAKAVSRAEAMIAALGTKEAARIAHGLVTATWWNQHLDPGEPPLPVAQPLFELCDDPELMTGVCCELLSWAILCLNEHPRPEVVLSVMGMRLEAREK